MNNAGVLRDQMSFKMDEDAWDAVIRVHLKGHFAPTRFAREHWRAQSKAGDDSGGRMINTVSEAGLYGGTGQANYAAAKAGIAGMTIALARELKNYGVTVNAIAPRAAHAHDRDRARRLRRAAGRRRLRRVGSRTTSARSSRGWRATTPPT